MKEFLESVPGFLLASLLGGCIGWALTMYVVGHLLLKMF